MGSRARIVVYASEEPVEAARRAFDKIDAVDRALSDYTPASEARQLTRRPAGVWYQGGPILMDALHKAGAVYDASSGDFDVTIGSVTSLWRRATQEGRSPTDQELEFAQARVGSALIELDRSTQRVRFHRGGMILDFGGLGKGLAVDLAIASLRSDGYAIVLVEIGGDLAVGDPPPGTTSWRILATDGMGPGTMLELANEAAATSGDAFRFLIQDGDRVSHVLDPSSGRPVPTGRACTVIAEHGWIADAVATVARLRGIGAARATAGPLGDVRVITQP